MTIDIGFAGTLVYFLVFVRLAGMILLNPLLARNNVPNQVRMGLILFLTLLIAPMQGEAARAAVYTMSALGFAGAVVTELAIGAIFGFVFQIFYYFLFFAGESIDTDMGLSMAKTFDPATNIQTSFSSGFLTLMFSMFIFATGSHLAMIRIFTDTFGAIQVGTFSLNISIVTFVLRLFTSIFSLVLRLVAPFMVAEFVMQMGMGILMKFIPQITVFVINFQLRILLGFIMLYAFAPFIGQFVDNYIDVLFNNLVDASRLMGAG